MVAPKHVSEHYCWIVCTYRAETDAIWYCRNPKYFRCYIGVQLCLFIYSSCAIVAWIMDVNVQRQVEKIAELVQSWPSTEIFTFLFTGNDSFDPDFVVSCDVYYHQQVPSSRLREKSFSFAQVQKVMSRFDELLVEDIPLQLFYRNTKEVLARRRTGGQWVLSTYPLWRVMNAKTLEPSPWLEETRAFLRALPSEFWSDRISDLHSQSLQLFNEMRIASMLEDEIRFSLALSAFFSSLIQYLCAKEQRFDLPPSKISHYLASTSLLSEDIRNRITILLQMGTTLSLFQKVEIAQLVIYEIL